MRGCAHGACMVGSACKQEIRLSLSVCLARSGGGEQNHVVMCFVCDTERSSKLVLVYRSRDVFS
jgi:hypothetical protein